MDNIHYTLSFTPEDAKDFGGLEGVAKKVLELLDTQESHGKDVKSVYEEGDALVLEFVSESDQNFFINEIYQ